MKKMLCGSEYEQLYPAKMITSFDGGCGVWSASLWRPFCLLCVSAGG